MTAGPTFLAAEGLCKSYPTGVGISGRGRGRGRVALDDVSLEIAPGGALAVVGESGSGKSTLARAVLRLVALDRGRILLGETDLTALRGRALRHARRDLQGVFQDPGGSLDPRMRVGAIVGEGLAIHRLVAGRREREERVAELLARVGLPFDMADRSPHELSGGEKQRVAIARALAVGPRLLVADEPLSALDLPVQAQIVNLLLDLQEHDGLTYLFITHDLRVVPHLATRIAVMLLGRLVEEGATPEVYAQPWHPYTRALLAAIPRLDAGGAAQPASAAGRVTAFQAGEPPRGTPPGCPYLERCPVSGKPPECREARPVLRDLGGGHRVACHVV